MTNCKHFVVRWAGPGNDTSPREKKNQTWGGESHGLKKKKKKKNSFFDLFLIEELLGPPQQKIPWPSFPSLPRLDNLIPPPEKGFLLFFLRRSIYPLSQTCIVFPSWFSRHVCIFRIRGEKSPTKKNK